MSNNMQVLMTFVCDVCEPLAHVCRYCCSDKEASYVPQFHLGQWEGHILSSLPFYMLLLPLLLQLIKSRVSTQAAKALQDLAKVALLPSYSHCVAALSSCYLINHTCLGFTV